MKTTRLILCLVILLVLFLFGAFNYQPVRLKLFSYQTPELPLFLIVVFVFFLGVFLSALYYGFKTSLLRRQIGQLQRDKEALQKDLANRSSSNAP